VGVGVVSEGVVSEGVVSEGVGGVEAEERPFRAGAWYSAIAAIATVTVRRRNGRNEEEEEEEEPSLAFFGLGLFFVARAIVTLL
jgi:hypothetical protein